MRPLAAILALLLAGCSTYRPYTPREKTLMGAALTAQALDVATTSYVLSDGGIEANGLWWGNDSGEMLAAMLSTKIVICGTAYLAGQAWPDARPWLWSIVGAGGAAGATWNTYQIIDNQ
jgi:hypothetical protein